MPSKIDFSGKKEDVIKSVTDQMDKLVKAKDANDEHKTLSLALLNALPYGNISGSIDDRNAGVVNINISTRPVTVDVEQSATVTTGKNKGMPGAAEMGRPELAPSAQPAK